MLSPHMDFPLPPRLDLPLQFWRSLGAKYWLVPVVVVASLYAAAVMTIA